MDLSTIEKSGRGLGGQEQEEEENNWINLHFSPFLTCEWVFSIGHSPSGTAIPGSFLQWI